MIKCFRKTCNVTFLILSSFIIVTKKVVQVLRNRSFHLPFLVQNLTGMAKSDKFKTYISFILISKRTFDFYGRLKSYKAFDIITIGDD